MAVVYIPTLLQSLTGGRSKVEASGATVREIIDSLEQSWPGLRDRLVDAGRLRPNLSVAVDGEITPLALLEKVSPTSEVHFVAAIKGGRSAGVLACALFLAPLALQAAPLTLIQNGASAHSICLTAAASPSEKRAAAELQHFLREMSGATLSIVPAAAAKCISIGAATPDPALGAEGFVLKTQGPHLLIAGGRERGTLYGVYAFLEKLGCRWFAPGVSRIPKRATIRIAPLNETQRPAFEYREVFFTEAWDKDWSARNKVNGQSHKLDESTGGKIQYYPFVHSFYQMLPPEKYFKDHPEYFSLIDGKRRWERGQLCLTNPAVLRLGVEAVRGWIREHPEAKIFSVSQNDWTGWCECDNCRRVEEEEGGAHSGPLLRYVNQLAAEIEKDHPDKLIDTLAYWYTERPPSTVRPRRNVRIRLCPIGACEAHPYEECPYNRFFVDILQQWSKITSQLYIWHYNTNFSHYLLPFPDFDEFPAEAALYRRNGVVGIFFQGAYAPGGGGENAELRSYLMARLLWNPAAVHVDREVDDFLEAYYGKAAKAMRAYYDLTHRQVRQGRHLWIFVNPRVPYLNPAFLRQAAGLLSQAEAAAENEAIRRRVRKARLSIDYVELSRARQFRVRDGVYAPDGVDALRRRFSDFVAQAKAFGIQQLHEGRAIAEDEAAFAAIRPYRAATLENEALRVTAVPELDGRIIELVDRRSGVNVLRVPDAGSRGYPDLSGAVASVFPDYHGRAYTVKWNAEAQTTPAGIVMRGRTGEGLAVTRRLRLEADQVRATTEVENTSANPIRVALQARAEYSPNDDLDGAGLALRYSALDGAAVDRMLFQPGQETTGSIVLTGTARPAGVWTAYHRSPVPVLTNWFDAAQAERCAMNWSLRGASVITLTVWSREAELAPGEKLALEVAYGVTR